MPLIACILRISVELWSNMKIKSDLIETTQVYLPNAIV